MNAEKMLSRLNKLSPQLEFAAVSPGVWEADYFGDELTIVLPVQRGRPCSPAIFSLTHQSGARAVLDLPPGMGGCSYLVKFLKGYLCQRPFTIVRHSHGLWALLDPNGFDLIGDYVTLRDARRTSGQHYRL